jgi:hypothetical protein
LEWKQAVEYLSSAVEAPESNWRNLEYPVVLNALTGWLNSSLTEGYSESAYEAFSKRVVFLFNNDYTLTLGTGITPTIARLSKEITRDQSLPFEGMLAESWDYVRAVNGWRRRENLSNEDLDNFLITIAEEVGEFPTLVLPLKSEIEELPYLKEDNHGLLKSSKDYPTWIRFLDLFTEEKMQKTIDTLGLSLIVCDNDEYVSEHCDKSRLLSLKSKLYWDESSDLSLAKRDWLEAFDEMNYLPDGTLSAVVYDLDTDEERSLRKLASEFGLDAGPWQEGKFVAEGDVWFHSEN